jgi:hypothetical protein
MPAYPPTLIVGGQEHPRSERTRVELSAERWAHIVDGHPELETHEADVLRAVEAPTSTRPGRAPDERWHYLAGAGPSTWLKVVVVFDSSGRGRIITAFPRRRKP